MDESRSRPPEEAGGKDRSPPGGPSWYILRLYVTGGMSSLRAIARVREICEEFLPGRYQLQVIDIYQQPALADGDHITAAPTLVRRAPGPLRKLIGDLSNRERILAGLELQAAAGG
ncbi:MAG: circadian clock KaiB family protein [Thermoanaerobaculia bacterium]